MTSDKVQCAHEADGPCRECGYKNPTVAHIDITAPEGVHRWCVGGPCPLCGMPAPWSNAEKKCSPLSGCAAWTKRGVFIWPSPLSA